MFPATTDTEEGVSDNGQREGKNYVCMRMRGFAGHVRERHLETYEEGNNKGKAAKMDVYETGIRKHYEEKHLYHRQ